MTIKSQARTLRNKIGRVFAGEAGRRHAAVGPAHKWHIIRQFQINFLKKQGLEPRHWLIDIGCGTLRGGIPLIKYLDNNHYTGIEVREDVLQLGRDELRQAGLEYKQPQLVHSTGLSVLQLGHHAEYVWAFSVLIHMDDDAFNACLAFVCTHLTPSGSFYGDVSIGEGDEGNWQGFPIVRRSMKWYTRTAERFGLTLEDLGSLKELGHDDDRPNPQTRRMLRFSHIDQGQNK